MRCFAIAGLIVLLSVGAAWALGEPVLAPANWPDEATYEFAIFDNTTNTRIATAYYRMLTEETEGRPVYRIKYVGRNELISEAAECWIHRDTLKPLRSTRKVVAEGRTYYQDNAYTDGVVIIRRKYEGGEIFEEQVQAPPPVYDYEQLMWLIPQIDFQGQQQIYINIFVTIRGNVLTMALTDLGEQPLTVLGKSYTAHCYSFDVNMTPYKLWTVTQDGQTVTARLDTGQNSFINLGLDSAIAAAAAAPPPPPPPAIVETPPAEEEQPAEAPEEEAPEEEPEEEPSDPNVNPLGPPPPGSRF